VVWTIKKKYYEFWEIGIQNSVEIQDGRQTRMFHNSVNFHLSHFKLWIWERGSNFFSKLQNGGLNQGVSNHFYFLLALTQSFLNRFQNVNLVLTCRNKHYDTSVYPKKYIQNGVEKKQWLLTSSWFNPPFWSFEKKLLLQYLFYKTFRLICIKIDWAMEKSCLAAILILSAIELSKYIIRSTLNLIAIGKILKKWWNII
jgi:hypothetical protein